MASEGNDIRDRRAADVDPKPVEWLWDNRLPLRGVSHIVGPKGVAKTTLACWLARQVTTGGWGQAGPVFFSTQEDDVESTLRPRLESAEADLEHVRFPDEGEHLKFPRDAERLARYLNARRPRLAIFDSLEAHIPRFTNPEQAGEALERLHFLSGRYGCAMLFLHHFNKSGRTMSGRLVEPVP